MQFTRFPLVLFAMYAVTLPFAIAVQFADCGNAKTIHHVLIEGCDSEAGVSTTSGGFCLIPRGRDLWFRAMFVPNGNYSQVKTDFRARIGFFERPLAGAVEMDACKGYLKCPLSQNAPQWVNTTFHVPTYVPRVGVTVTLKLLSPLNTVKGTNVDQIIMCGQTMIQLY